MGSTTDRFLDKLEVFAATLDADEQAILAHLLDGDDEVSGFGFAPGGRIDPVVSGPIPIPFACLRPKIDSFTAPGGSGGVMGSEAGKGEL